MTQQVDVAIVGAGFAGLAAARELVKAGRRVVVLEARDRAGGRSCNHRLTDGSSVDIGAQWIGPGQDRIVALAKEMGVESYPTCNDGDTVVEINGHIHRGLAEIPRDLFEDYVRVQTLLDDMAREIPIDEPWTAARAAEWDAQTVDTWLRANCRTSGARAVVGIAFRAVFAAEPANCSLLHALFYIRAAGSYGVLVGIEGGAQQDILYGGTQLIAMRVAERLGDAVELNAPIHHIEHSGRGVRLTSERLSIDAEHAIVTVPPALAARIAYDPALPPLRDQLTQRMPHGSVIKMQIVYARPFWRDKGLSGWTASDIGPICATMDGSRPNEDRGILVGFLEGRQASELGRLSAFERRREVLDHLQRLLGAEAARPVEYVDRDWSAEPWTRGCYGAHLPPGVWTQFGPALREPLGRLHWAGTETARAWAGYLDGAIESGQRAAAAVLAARP